MNYKRIIVLPIMTNEDIQSVKGLVFSADYLRKLSIEI